MRPTRRWIRLEPPTITLVGHDGLLWDEIGPARTSGSKKGSLIDRPSCGQPAGQKIIVGLVGCSSGSADDPKSAIGELVGKVRELGNGILLERFRGAKAIATPKVTEMMRKQTSPQVMAGLWNKRFPGLIPKNIVFAEQLEGDTLHLEGHELVVVDVGHTDTDNSTCLYVPSVGLVVAGDLAYNDVHQYFAESLTREKRMEWVAALDKVEALKPRVVIAGHKRETNGDGPNIINETRQYILDFDRLIDKTSTTAGLYDAMLSLYPDRLNRGALWGSARAIKG